MRILLVYPEFPDTFWSFKHALRFIHRKAASPPSGVANAAALFLDPVPPPAAVPISHNAGIHGLPFPPSGGDARS
jgi:hypothetical protein